MGTINIYSGNGANKAGLTYNGSGDITVDTEHLANTSSSIQSQLDAKLPSAGGTLTGTLVVNTAGNSLPSVSLSHSNTNADNFMLTGGVPGTSNAGFSIRDVDASANRLVIDTTGNVGIGTTSPSAKLHVDGNTKIGNYSSGPATGSAVTNSVLNVYASTNLGQSAGDELKLLSLSGHSGNQSALTFRQKRNADGNNFFTDCFTIAQDVDNSPNHYQYMTFSEGRVGIGTDSPAHRFHINQPGNSPQMRISGNANWDFYAYNDSNFYINCASGTVLGLLANRSAYFDGNVGIGTPSPSAKLDVQEASAGATIKLTESSDAGSNPAAFIGYRSRGTSLSSPTTIQANNYMTQFAMGAHDGTSYSVGAKTMAIATENWTTSAHGTSMGMYTTSNGSTTPQLRLNIDAAGVTIPDKLQPSTYEPNIKWVQVTGGFNGSGGTAATSMTWYPITNQSINNYNSDYSGGDRGVNFMIKWTSGNVNRGYHHTVSGHIPILSANSYISYQNATYSTQASGTSMSEGLNLNICHHTGCASGHNIQCRLFGDGGNYGSIYLQIRAEAPPQNGDAYISFWKV